MSVAPGGLAAVLFDMDGLLVDSEPMWFAAEAEVAAAYGVTWTHEHQRACLGGPMHRTVTLLVTLSGGVADPVQVEAQLIAAMARRLASGVPLRPGADALLAELDAAGVPRALVSSSFRRMVDLVLAALPAGTFAVSVAGDEVHHRKPHPEPYLTATARLGVRPADCVVLEDSLTGVAAAEAAGCACIAVPDLVPVPATPTRPVVASLAELDLPRLRRLVAAAA